MSILEGPQQRHDDNVVLAMLPDDYMLQERAILLAKQKKYGFAIDIAVD